MAFIGSNIPGGAGLQPTFNRPAPALQLGGPAGPAGPGGPTNLGYGRQALSDIDLVMALLLLLKAQGANGAENSGGCGQCGPMDPSSLQASGGKGGGRSLKRSGGKGAGRAPSLPQAPAKAAPKPSLKMAGAK